MKYVIMNVKLVEIQTLDYYYDYDSLNYWKYV